MGTEVNQGEHDLPKGKNDREKIKILVTKCIWGGAGVRSEQKEKIKVVKTAMCSNHGKSLQKGDSVVGKKGVSSQTRSGGGGSGGAVWQNKIKR